MDKNSYYKIVCICQVYNEIEKGNLSRFYQYIKPLVDEIVIYDDASTDGTYEYSTKQTSNVIRGTKNDFKNEIAHRQLMLDKALELSADFILWLDADEVLSIDSKEKLQSLCQECVKNNFDGVVLKELNIWRSRTWRRTDSSYDAGWFNRLWKVIPGIAFSVEKTGLHQDLFPPMIKKIMKSNDIFVLHYGFANEINLAYKYLTYRNHGQHGYEMLDRLISEEKIELERIPKNIFPDGLWNEDELKPEKISFSNSLAYVDRLSPRVFRPKYSIICLIYKSVDWLEFIYAQVLKYTDLTDKEFYFIANDADEIVLEYLRNNYIPHYVLTNRPEQTQEWYINNVYRGYNFGAKMAKGDFIIFINSDMAFTPHWLEYLLESYDGSNCVASRLIESGKLEVGKNGLKKNFGKTISEFKEDDFQRYAQIVYSKEIINSGLYMPLFIRKDKFENVGGYPEGNIKKNSKDIFHPEIAKLGDELISGDRILIEKLKTIGVRHQTSFESLVYHFQCGEKDETETKGKMVENIEIAVCNDLVTGSMGEKVFWNYLIEGLCGAFGVDHRLLGGQNFTQKAKRYIREEHSNTKVIIQNASFINYIDRNIYTIVLLQDDLRSMGRQSSQQESNLKLADKIVTNSYQTAAVYRDYPCEVIPVGVDSDLFKPKNKLLLRKKHGISSGKIGIFVGDFSEVKGWSKVRLCIEKNLDIHWILVTKKNEDFIHPNVRVYKRINQELLAELINCADFFIIGSPVETQCLAAIEACLCNVPVIMRDVGLFKDLSEDEKSKVGIIGEDFEFGIKNITKHKYSPRTVMLSKGLTVEDSLAKWNKLVENCVLAAKLGSGKLTDQNKDFSDLWFRLEFFYRKKVLKPIFGKEEFNLKRYFSKEHLFTMGGLILRKIGLLNVVKRLLGFKTED